MLNDVAVATLDPRRFQAVLGQVTKRVHNLLHGQPGDHDALGDPDRAV